MNNNNLETLFDRIGLPDNSDTRAHAAGLIEALVDQKITEAQLQVIERILEANYDPKNKGFAGTWRGSMAATCGEVAIIYEELEAQLNPQKPGKGERVDG